MHIAVEGILNVSLERGCCGGVVLGKRCEGQSSKDSSAVQEHHDDADAEQRKTATRTQSVKWEEKKGNRKRKRP
jgi:hypothetical protein